MECRRAGATRARYGASFSPPGRCGTSRRRRAQTWVSSLGGTAPRSRVACSWRRRPSRRASSPARTRMQTSISPLRSSTRRWARRGLASVCTIAAATCARPQHPAAPLTPGEEPELRIGLAVGASSVTLGGDGELFVTDDGNGQPIGSIPAGVAWTVVPDTGGLRLVPPGGSPTERHGGISAVSVTENRFAMVSRRRYRGRVNVVRAGSGLTVMNRVPVESYLAGVLGGEIGIRRAEEARGRPYLRPISDASGGGHHYCDLSPRFRWREEWDGTKLRSILSRTRPPGRDRAAGGDGLQRITDVAVTGTGPSGRVTELRIVWEDGDVRVPGPDVRAVLRPEPDRLLQSTAFQLFVTRQDGQVTRLVAAGTGSGHGLGLCQWGAIGRARAGQDYRKILTTYFPGTRLERLY